MKYKNYEDRFFALKCSGDVINAVTPIKNFSEEITRSMAIIKRIKGKILSNPGKYVLVDMCAGQCLTSVIAAHLLPVDHVLALDIKSPKIYNYNLIKKFSFLKADVSKTIFGNSGKYHYIIIASLPYGQTNNIVNTYLKNKSIEALCVIPCLPEKYILKNKNFLENSYVSDYDIWSYYLSTILKGSKLEKDFDILGQYQNIIYHEK